MHSTWNKKIASISKEQPKIVTLVKLAKSHSIFKLILLYSTKTQKQNKKEYICNHQCKLSKQIYIYIYPTFAKEVTTSSMPLTLIPCRNLLQTSSSFSSMFGMPSWIGNTRPVSGHSSVPSTTSTSIRMWCSFWSVSESAPMSSGMVAGRSAPICNKIKYFSIKKKMIP